MGSRLAELTEQFESATERVLTLVDAVPDDQWSTVTAGEGWSVAAVTHHIARAIRLESDLIDAVAHGLPIADAFNYWSILHGLNAEGADAHAACTKTEVRELVRTNRAHALALLSSLTEADLGNAAVVPIIDAEPVTAGQLIEWVLIGHIDRHMANITAVVG